RARALGGGEPPHGRDVTRPARLLVPQTGSSRPGEGVVPGTAPLLRGPPTGLQPATLLEAMKGGIERPFFDLQLTGRRPVDEIQDLESVELRMSGERPERQELEGPFDDRQPFLRHGTSPGSA